jgi:hypothetical protein
MRVFMVACFAVAVIALGTAAVLVEFVQASAATAFTEPSAHSASVRAQTLAARARVGPALIYGGDQ